MGEGMKSVIAVVLVIILTMLVLGSLVGTNVIPLPHTALRGRKKKKKSVAKHAAYMNYQNSKAGDSKLRDVRQSKKRLNPTSGDSVQKQVEQKLPQKTHDVSLAHNLEQRDLDRLNIVGKGELANGLEDGANKRATLDDVFAIRDQDGFDKQWAQSSSSNMASDKVRKAAKGRALLMPEFSQNSQPSRMIGQSNDIAYKMLRPQKEIVVTSPVVWNGSDHHERRLQE